MVLTTAVVAGLETAMVKLTDTLKESILFADSGQKASLALGMTFEQAQDRMGGSIDGLRGSLEQKFTAGLLTLEAGLQGNTAGVSKLINQQQLTGTAYKQTASMFARLEGGLGLSRDETNKLAEATMDVSKTYNVSTDKLAGLIDSLKATFPVQQLAGIGPEFSTALQNMMGRMGPALSGDLQKVANMILDTSQEGFVNLSKLGIENVRSQLAQAKTAQEAEAILVDAIKTGSETFRTIAGQGDVFFRGIGIATEVFGQTALNMDVVAQNLENRVADDTEKTITYANTLDTLIKEGLNPFKEVVVEFHEPLVTTVVTLNEKLIPAFRHSILWIIEMTKGIKGVVNWFGGLRNVIAGLGAAFVAFKVALVVAGLGVYTAFLPITLVAGALIAAFWAVKKGLEWIFGDGGKTAKDSTSSLSDSIEEGNKTAKQSLGVQTETYEEIRAKNSPAGTSFQEQTAKIVGDAMSSILGFETPDASLQDVVDTLREAIDKENRFFVLPPVVKSETFPYQY